MKILPNRCTPALGPLLPAVFAALVAMSLTAMAQEADEGAPAPLGGGCEYVEIPGTASIDSIEKTPVSAEQATTGGGPGYEGFEIRYTFTPSEPITDADIQAWAKQEHTLQLANSWYPGPRYVEKYGLTKGATLNAVLRVQTAGTCTPYVVDFPDLDLTDYFESVAAIRPRPALAALR
jgi:hypothetical protein